VPHSNEMGKISFNYLPASPLVNGWRLALKDKPLLKISVPPDRSDGLTIQADDAIDCDVEKYQRVCNRVEFAAKLCEQSYAYARVRLVSRDRQSVSREAWITCDIGERPPRKESRDEWVIYRKPNNDGWTKFELLLPDEVSHTFGQAEGLQFSELLGFRLRGSLSISPIKLYSDDSAEKTTDERKGTSSAKSEPWSRADKIGICLLVIAILAIIVALTVPEVRRFFGLEKPAAVRTQLPPTALQPAVGESHDILAAQVAKDIRELRQQNHVTRLADSESEKTFAEISANSYGFVDALEFTLTSSDKLSIDANHYLLNFEIQKLGDGSGLIVGYVGPETFERLREGVSPTSGLTLYSHTWKDAPNLVAIPIRRLKCSRSRTLDVEGESHNLIGVKALDCEVR
jgi:hypothetical protein